MCWGLSIYQNYSMLTSAICNISLTCESIDKACRSSDSVLFRAYRQYFNLISGITADLVCCDNNVFVSIYINDRELVFC
jgi:hypothetical protein